MCIAPTAPKKAQPTCVSNLDHSKEWERLRLKAYMPTRNDKWTIGWGHTSTAFKGMVITEKQAAKLLRADLKQVEAGTLVILAAAA